MKPKPRATSTHYRTPARPLPLRILNQLMRPLLARGAIRIPLGESSLIRAAEERTRLSDLGDPSFREPMRVLLRAIEREADLHPIGRMITRERLVTTLATRMRLEALLRKHPEIEATPIMAPIVIVGLPRTGTTLLHRLLASDRRLRALSSWEALAPVPLDEPNERERRMRGARQAELGLRFMAPDFFAVHPIDALAPEEDVLLLDLAFRSTVPESTLRVPSYAAWLEEQDQRPAYEYMKRVLQALSRGANRRWVLKTPHHLEWLDVLLATYPDALIVWTHRNPLEVVPSFCSMLAHGRGVFSDTVDPHEIGRSWLRKGARMMSRAMEVRARVGESRFVDVPYQELVADPLAVASMITERADMRWSKDPETCMRDTLRKERQHRYGVHRYELADFGLSATEIDRAFEKYRETFRM